MAKQLTDKTAIHEAVSKALAAQPIIDMHTHLFPPTFGTPDGNPAEADENGLLLWGIDELLTYHYLVAEVFRSVPPTELPYEKFWQMSKQRQADHIWKELFIDRSPISEATRGVITTLKLLGLDPADRDLAKYRKWFVSQNPSDYINKVMQLANVESITMTNAVFDDNERNRWLADPAVGRDDRFRGVLRIDSLLRDWPSAAKKLAAWGYDVELELTSKTIDEAQRFLREWLDRVNAIYVAVSLGPDFRYPADTSDAVAVAGQNVLEKVVLPVCRERGLPLAMMVGSQLQVNPALRDAGDMVGKSAVSSIVNLCGGFPSNKFFCTMLALENQHELCVAGRKFGNLMVFGCWWFLNTPSSIDQITRQRLELLGTSFIPQHSDARVLDQLIYKWVHSCKIICNVLTDKYADLIQAGWALTEQEVRRDVKLLMHDNFEQFLQR